MQHQTLFVFDIETIPDVAVLKNLTGSDEENEFKLRLELEQYHLSVTDGKNSFPRQLFHKVVAISFLEAEIHKDADGERYVLKELRSGGKDGATEKELLEGLFKYLARNRARLVSFNGRAFDLPVLRYRAMVHGLQAKWLYSSGDKWNSYMSRYSLDWHCDLLEALSDFGASARIKLDEVCAVLGFPGKFGVDGGKVGEMYSEGRTKEIRDYCETDVLNTYLVYLRHMHHRGEITTVCYNESIEAVLVMIDSQKDVRAHLGRFLDAWDEACGGKFTL
jgi:predicted PolB exonuclease-like 3'-5' exonuclease